MRMDVCACMKRDCHIIGRALTDGYLKKKRPLHSSFIHILEKSLRESYFTEEVMKTGSLKAERRKHEIV